MTIGNCDKNQVVLSSEFVLRPFCWKLSEIYTLKCLFIHMVFIIYSVCAVSFVAELPNSRRKEIEAIHSVLRSEVRKIKDCYWTSIFFFFEGMAVTLFQLSVFITLLTTFISSPLSQFFLVLSSFRWGTYLHVTPLSSLIFLSSFTCWKMAWGRRTSGSSLSRNYHVLTVCTIAVVHLLKYNAKNAILSNLDLFNLLTWKKVWYL